MPRTQHNLNQSIALSALEHRVNNAEYLTTFHEINLIVSSQVISTIFDIITQPLAGAAAVHYIKKGTCIQ